MPRRLPKYVHAFVDRGIPRHYFRKKGLPRVALPGLPWSEVFMAAYAIALAGKAPSISTARPSVQRVGPGSLTALIRDFKNDRFSGLGKVTCENYTRLLNRLEEKAGHLPVALLTSDAIKRMVNERTKEGGPEAGNSTLRIFRALMSTAVDFKYRKDNPALGIKRKQRSKDDEKKVGWETMSEANIAKFFQRWKIGTRQHLAMMALLYTGQRRGDIVRIGPRDVEGYDLAKLEGCRISLKQSKTGKDLQIPLASPLIEALRACEIPADAPAFILTEAGKPYSAKSFTGKFTAWGRTAGIVDQCSPHTLRYAAARRLAEIGLSLKVIASITGHDSLKELERYIKEADQASLAQQAIEALEIRHSKD